MATATAALEGTLEDFPIASLLRFVAGSSRTGTLKIAATQAVGLWFEAGWLTLGAPLDPDAMRILLTATGHIRHGGWDAAMRLRRSRNLRMVDALSRVGGADPEVIDDVLYDLAVDTIFELMLPTAAAFAFVDTVDHPLASGRKFEVSDVVESATGRFDTWRHIAASIPSVTAVPRVLPDLPIGVDGVHISREEWPVLWAIDGRRDVTAIITHTGLSAFGACGLLHRLVGSGAVTFD